MVYIVVVFVADDVVIDVVLDSDVVRIKGLRTGDSSNDSSVSIPDVVIGGAVLDLTEPQVFAIFWTRTDRSLYCCQCAIHLC